MNMQSLDLTPMPEWYEQIIDAINELNRDMEELKKLISSEPSSDTEKQNIINALKRVLEKKWIANMLPALESIVSSDAWIRGWLEHALIFMYGITPEEMIDDPEVLQRIITTTYLWRIIWPLLLNLASNNTITFSWRDFRTRSVWFCVSTSTTPKHIQDILDWIK